MDYFLWYKTALYGDSLHSTSSCVISLEKKPIRTLASEKNVQGSVEASRDQKVEYCTWTMCDPLDLRAKLLWSRSKPISQPLVWSTVLQLKQCYCTGSACSVWCLKVCTTTCINYLHQDFFYYWLCLASVELYQGLLGANACYKWYFWLLGDSKDK